MMVSLKHRLVLFAMPKCASTALEAALAVDMDIVITRHPAAKHTPVRKYQRQLRRYFESYTNGPLETVSMFREPISWLNSWWRYRGRPALANPARSTHGMSFDAFAAAYMAGDGGPTDVGSQARFVTGIDDAVGVDRLFRYENVNDMVAYLETRLDRPIVLDRRNVSPCSRPDDGLSPETDARLRVHLSKEFEIYDRLAK